MARTPMHYTDQRNDAISIVQALARVPGRHDSVMSNPGTKAEAYSYRQRIYRWRRHVLATLADLDSPEAAECLRTLRNIIGPRFSKNWLDYTRFDIVPPEYGTGWCVRGSIGRVMFGPDITFTDAPEVADMRALLDLAARRGA